MEKKKSPSFPTGFGKDGVQIDWKARCVVDRAFRFFWQSRDSYLAEVAAIALALLAS
jgi:hypothetical protein